MASVRKRYWYVGGVRRSAWVLDYVDAGGTRRSRQFKLKKDADEHLLTVEMQLRAGTHVAASASTTVAQASESWLQRCERDGLDPLTVEDYERHVRLRILPTLGVMRLSTLTPPIVERFVDGLASDAGRDMAGRVLKSLKAVMAHAVRMGLLPVNPAAGVRVTMRARQKQVVVIPAGEEVRRLVAAAGRSRVAWLFAFVLTLLLTGMRSSEIRGLAWSDVDMEGGVIHVRRRADRRCRLGPVKSAAARRSLPIPAALVEALRAWRSLCPAGRLDLVFPTAAGTVMSYSNLVKRTFDPLLVEAGLTTSAGEPKWGLHALRHYCISGWIHRRVDLKRLTTWAGHADVRLTINTYGHLISAEEADSAVVASMQADLLGDGDYR